MKGLGQGDRDRASVGSAQAMITTEDRKLVWFSVDSINANGVL